jgi:DNA-binding NarL/FixJ family response regulator
MTEIPRDPAAPSEITRNETRRRVTVLVRDLIFSSRIAAVARAAGVPITLLRDPARLADPAPPRGPGLLIVDLNLPGSIDAATQWKHASPSREVVGFVSHVDAATIDHARAAGLDRVLPRSRFVEILPELLA